MADRQTPNAPRWQPTWARLVAGTVAVFLGLLGFLAGREQAGADPALSARAKTTTKQTTTPSSTTSTTQDDAQATPSYGSGTTSTGSTTTQTDPNPPTTQAS